MKVLDMVKERMVDEEPMPDLVPEEKEDYARESEVP